LIGPQLVAGACMNSRTFGAVRRAAGTDNCSVILALARVCVSCGALTARCVGASR
jgi:hypothetical protein